MPRRTDIRLSRELIVDAALRVSEASSDAGVEPTGQALGSELGVDRSAIWRHFRDKDELLQATADAMLAPVTAGIDRDRSPLERLRWVWTGIIDAFLLRPRVGERMASRFASEPNALAVIEEVLTAMRDLGVPPGDDVREYRAFIDMTLAYAAMLAQYSVLDPARAREDRDRTLLAVRALPESGYPALRAAGDELVAISEDPRVVVFENYAVGLGTRYGADASTHR